MIILYEAYNINAEILTLQPNFTPSKCLTTTKSRPEILRSLRQPLVVFSRLILKGKDIFYAFEIGSPQVAGHETEGNLKEFLFVWLYFILVFNPRHDDLKSMLDSSKDNLKLDAMKRIISVSKIL